LNLDSQQTKTSVEFSQALPALAPQSSEEQSRCSSKETSPTLEGRPALCHQSAKEKAPHRPGKLQPSESSVMVPPLVPASAATRSKCMALASMLAEVEAKNAGKWNVTEADENAHFEEFGVPAQSLGPGMMFGELALLSDHPRACTVSCREDCEFLLIGREDFCRILKIEMKKVNGEKLEFLNKCVKAHAPAMRWVTEANSDVVLRHVEKLSTPRHHHFITMGDVPDGSIYFVSKGAVACNEKVKQAVRAGRPSSKASCSRDARCGTPAEVIQYGVLGEGSIFGAVSSKTHMPYSIVSAASPCEVLRLSPGCLKLLPDSVVHGLRDLIENGMSRRMQRRPRQVGPVGNCANVDKSAGVALQGRPGSSLALENVKAPPPKVKGFVQVTSGNLRKNMHLNLKAAPAGPCRRVGPARAAAPGRGYITSDQDRRGQIRSNLKERRRGHTRSSCSSRGSSRASSRNKSRSCSRPGSIDPSKISGFIDTGSRSPSRENLRAALTELGVRPFLDVCEGDDGRISKAGRHPGCDFALAD